MGGGCGWGGLWGGGGGGGEGGGDIPRIVDFLRSLLHSRRAGFQKPIFDAGPCVAFVRQLVVYLCEVCERLAQRQADDAAGGVKVEFGEEGGIDCCWGFS